MYLSSLCLVPIELVRTTAIGLGVALSLRQQRRWGRCFPPHCACADKKLENENPASLLERRWSSLSQENGKGNDIRDWNRGSGQRLVPGIDIHSNDDEIRDQDREDQNSHSCHQEAERTLSTWITLVDADADADSKTSPATASISVYSGRAMHQCASRATISKLVQAGHGASRGTLDDSRSNHGKYGESGLQDFLLRLDNNNSDSYSKARHRVPSWSAQSQTDSIKVAEPRLDHALYLGIRREHRDRCFGTSAPGSRAFRTTGHVDACPLSCLWASQHWESAIT